MFPNSRSIMFAGLTRGKDVWVRFSSGAFVFNAGGPRRLCLPRFRSHDASRGKIEEPCQDERDRKPSHDREHDNALRQSRHIKDGKDLRDYLHEQPARHDIGCPDLIDMAAL